MGKSLIIKGADFSKVAVANNRVILHYSDVNWIDNSQFISDSSNNSYGKIFTSDVIRDKSAVDNIDVREYKHIKTTVVKRTSSSSTGGLGFLDANKNIISGVLYRGESTDGYTVVDMDIPSGCCFVGTTAWTEPNGLGYEDWYMELT